MSATQLYSYVRFDHRPTDARTSRSKSSNRGKLKTCSTHYTSITYCWHTPR